MPDSNPAWVHGEAPESPTTASLATRIAVFLAVVLPFLGLVLGILLLWEHGLNGLQLGMLAAMYLVTTLGISVGFHRLFTHRSFETIMPVKLVLGIMGSMAVQGPLLKWVATHRRHHQHSDAVGDPHSPHLHGQGVLATLRGVWHAHIGWMFAADTPDLSRYVTDLAQDRLIRGVSAMFPLWVAAGLLIPAVLTGVLTGTWTGALLGFLWAGLVRVFLVHHVTWSINSVCHLWGGRPFRSHDQSRNNFIFGLLGMGEGWHNNHHAFPTSARHGLKWWQFDLTWLVIRTLKALRLAWKVRLPMHNALVAKLHNADGLRLASAYSEHRLMASPRPRAEPTPE